MQISTIVGKFQEFNFMILRLRIILSYNDTNIPENFPYLGGNLHKTPNIELILCVQNGV